MGPIDRNGIEKEEDPKQFFVRLMVHFVNDERLKVARKNTTASSATLSLFVPLTS